MSLPIDTKYLRLVSSRLRNFKQKNTYLFNFSCPYCGDSQKNKSKARGYVFSKGNDLIFKCHNCGVGANVGNFLKLLIPHYTENTLWKSIRQVNPITPIQQTQSSTYNRPNLAELRKQRYLNTQSGLTNYQVDIIV